MTAGNIETAFPLTPLQEGMLYHAIRHPGSPGYRGQCVADLEGPLDAGRFREAWSHAARRHQAFRTFFAWEGRDRPLQVVRARVDLPWEVLDWSGLAAPDRERDWEALLSDDASRPLELTVAPVMRLVLVRLGPERHRLLWSVHHMLADGWSTRRVLAEVLETYDALRSGTERGEAVVGDERPPSFAKFVTWLSSRDTVAAERYWREQLAGVRAATALPGAASRPPGGAKAFVEVQLSDEASQALREACTRMRVTPNTLALGAWSLVLSAYLEGVDDVLFGVTVSERPPEIPGVDGSMGLYLNTIPVRTEVPANAVIEGWLSDLQHIFADAREHSAGGVADIRGWSEVPSGEPLVRSLVVFESFPPEAEAWPESGDLRLASVEVRAPSDLPLALLVHPGDRPVLQLEHDTALHTPAAARRLLRAVACALEGLASPEATTLGDVELLDAEARRTVLEQWSGAETPAPPARDVVELFEASARTTPLADAIRSGDVVVTYGDLDEAANRLAHRIVSEGTGADALLGIPAERRVGTVVAALAALKAGRGYTMLDTRQPAARLDQMLAVVDRVLAPSDDDRWADRLLATDVLATDAVSDAPGTPPTVTADPSDIAYVVWTSGSTGHPKAVVVERGQLARSTAARLAHYGNGPDVFLLMSSFAVDSSVAGLYGTLCSGGCLVLPADRAEQDVGVVASLVDDASVTATLMLPSLYRALLEEADTRRLRSLRSVVVAGEACTSSVVELHRKRLPGVALHNEYGPSEATVWATVADLTAESGDKRVPGVAAEVVRLAAAEVVPAVAAEVPPAVEAEAATVTIGRAVPGVRVYLVDRRLRPVPPGAVGEICIGGGTVARGYLGDPAATRESFVDDPFVGRAGDGALTNDSGGRDRVAQGRLYRTGDRGRFREDGQLDFLGRLDDQIKLRGYRVEPAEVERAIEAHPGVTEAAVALSPSPRARRLVAYVTSDIAPDIAPPSVQALTAFVRERVPEHMIPSSFVVVERLPRTVAGKLDRSALGDLGGTELTSTEATGRPPRTSAEIALAEIWKEVLGLDAIDVDADFFALGGDSLLSIRALSRASRAGISITPEAFFEKPTIAHLAARTGARSTATEQGRVTGAFAPTPIQAWFFETITTGRDHWNQSFLFDAPSDLDGETLRRVVAALVSHHDALRLRFSCDMDEWKQVIDAGRVAEDGVSSASDPGTPVRVVDLTGLGSSERDARIQGEADRIHRSLDISAGRLFRAVLYLGDDGFRSVLLLAHHLVIDAISWGILLEDLSALVRQAGQGSALRLPPKTASVKAWAEALQKAAANVDVEEALRHWVATPGSTRPADASNVVADAETMTLVLDETETRALTEDATKRLGASAEEVVLGAFATAWTAWSGADRIRLDVEGHGRDALKGLDVSRTVGWFTTASPLVLDLAGATVDDAVGAVRRAIAALPGGRATSGLLRYLHPDHAVRSAMAAIPTSDIVFNYLSTVEDVLPAGADFAWTGDSVGCPRSDVAPRAYRFEVNALVRRGRLIVNLEYSKAEYERDRIEALVSTLRSTITTLVERAPAPGRSFDLAGLDDQDLSRVADLLAEIDEAS